MSDPSRPQGDTDPLDVPAPAVPLDLASAPAPEFDSAPVPVPVPASALAADQPGPTADEAAPRRPRNPRLPPDRYAIGALVTALLALFPVAVVLGHIALARVRVYEVGGHGIAVAALVIGYLGLVVGFAAWALYFAVVAPAVTLP
ncbi:MAG: hypothetical protein JWP66_1666 [Naasia sp.]|nr:hypothetical protein [Naasia sp.]